MGGGAGPEVVVLGSGLLRWRKHHHHMPRHKPTRARNTIGTAMPISTFSPVVKPEEEGLAVDVLLEEEDDAVQELQLATPPLFY